MSPCTAFCVTVISYHAKSPANMFAYCPSIASILVCLRHVSVHRAGTTTYFSLYTHARRPCTAFFPAWMACEWNPQACASNVLAHTASRNTHMAPANEHVVQLVHPCAFIPNVHAPTAFLNPRAWRRFTTK